MHPITIEHLYHFGLLHAIIINNTNSGWK